MSEFDQEIGQLCGALYGWVHSTSVRVALLENLIRKQGNLSQEDYEAELKRMDVVMTPNPAVDSPGDGLHLLRELLERATARTKPRELS